MHIVGFGNPAQPITVLIDTGSSELWVNPDCTTAKLPTQQAQCPKFGRYDPQKSTTPPIGPFDNKVINYGDPTDPKTRTFVNMTYYSDDLTFGNLKIKNQTFGAVTSSKGQAQGILGLAPNTRDGFKKEGKYSLVLNSMAKQGLINSRAFSLDLRHSDVDTGALIYGGIDRSKFIGNLEKLPLVNGSAGEFRLAVNMNTIAVNVKGKAAKTIKMPQNATSVMLDSGTTVSRLLREVALPIFEALGGKDDGFGNYRVPCSVRESEGSVDFGFGNTVVKVPYKDFVKQTSNVCYIGVHMTSDQQILGDSVLRAGYFVFDWDNQVVHIAQAANCGKSDIVVIGKGADSVSNVKGTCSEKDASFTGGPSNLGSGGSSNKDDKKNAGSRPEAMGWFMACLLAGATVLTVM